MSASAGPEPGRSSGLPAFAATPRVLRVRLLVLVALATVVVVGGTTYVESRIIEGVVEREALDAAGAAALGVAADLTEREALPTAAELEDFRIEFLKAVPSLRGLTVIRRAEGSAVVEATTDPRPPAGSLELGQEAIRRREIAVAAESPPSMRLVAVPLERDHQPYGAVVARMSMDAVVRVRHETRVTAAWVATTAILLLTALIDTLARRLVYRPLSAIQGTMGRAWAGDLQARAEVARGDEIGAVAQGLNAMLDRMSGFNSAMRDEVVRATGELRERNRQLVESAQRLFAARRDLARSEQLALTGRMAASVAHQIGTPLNLISGYVQMIQEELPSDSTAALRLRTVREQIGRVTAIVQGLLDQARQPVLHRRPVAPSELVSRVCELARPTFEAASIAVHTDVPPGLPEVSVDVGQLEQVFLNLFTNSIDALPLGGSVGVAGRAVGDQVVFEVSDSGSGIPAEDLGQIFDPLFTTKRPGKGTGLGLSIVRDVLAAHGGSVEVASQEGRGTRVIVRLPRAASVEPAVAPLPNVRGREG
jgi:signal transduction histidine kinase